MIDCGVQPDGLGFGFATSDTKCIKPITRSEILNEDGVPLL